MEKTKIGILGLKRGSAFVHAFKCMDDVEIKAVCETDPVVVAEQKPNLPKNTLFFDNFDQFIDCGLDAVILAEYFHHHAGHAITALNKGIHVLSETTAAPTLGECVKLCEAVEQSGCKYMLATNVPHMPGPLELARLYNDKTFGRVLYAEGEYFHPLPPNSGSSLAPTPYHWRNYLPRTYYNMHDLGTLMSITGTLPKKVSARAIFAPDIMNDRSISKRTGDVASIILNEMDSGAIFRTTACASLGPHGKWFRLTCENGTIESQRDDQNSIMYRYNEWAVPDGMEVKAQYPAPMPELPEMTEEQKKSGHGGTDFGVDRQFIQYIRGEFEPFFDVYRSVALSAAGILAWRSVLDDGKGYEIPDFRDREARKAVADDFLTPFPNPDGSGITLPCSSQKYE